MKTSIHLISSAFLVLAATGCVEDEQIPLLDEFDEDEATQPRVFGDAEYSGCDEDDVEFNELTLRFGRVAASSDAFAECIDATFRGVGGGPYLSCEGEPFADASIDVQIDRAIRMARSANGWSIDCDDPGAGNASTSQNDGWGHNNREDFDWHGWFTSVRAQVGQPLCGPTESPPGCRSAAFPWPYTQAAGIAWHEASHTHGYDHGANAQPAAITACGREGEAWQFQTNTAPYLIGSCIGRVLADSGRECGGLDNCPGDALRIVDGDGETTCSCLEDPAADGFASFEAENLQFEDVVHAASGTHYGTWSFDATNEVELTGDFDGDGDEEVLVRSAWGIGILDKVPAGNLTVTAARSFGNWVGGWNLSGTETFEAVGDFDSDGADEFVIRSAWGIGIMEKSGNAFALKWARSYNQNLGSYPLRAEDEVVGVGRFESPQRDDLLMHNEDGVIGILRLDGSVVSSSAVHSPGSWMGSWNHHESNSVALPADFDGDGLDEFVVRSGWGIGFIERRSSGALRSIRLVRNGTTLPELYGAAPGAQGWRLDNDDELVFASDMTQDGRAELVLRNDSGVGMVTLKSNNVAWSRTQFFHGVRLSGGWLLSDHDDFVAIGNFDGIGGDDLVVQSGWGIGVVAINPWNAYQLYSPVLRSYAQMLGGWFLQSYDVVAGVVDFDGDGVDEFILRRE